MAAAVERLQGTFYGARVIKKGPRRSVGVRYARAWWREALVWVESLIGIGRFLVNVYGDFIRYRIL